MINVDGVIYGNTRTDLAGFDLNRSWRRPLKELHPQVYTIKRHLVKLHRYNKIAICLDLHSHSKQYNFFTYNFKE
jgi:murein tripeptide amidase MpaA